MSLDNFEFPKDKIDDLFSRPPIQGGAPLPGEAVPSAISPETASQPDRAEQLLGQVALPNFEVPTELPAANPAEQREHAGV